MVNKINFQIVIFSESTHRWYIESLSQPMMALISYQRAIHKLLQPLSNSLSSLFYSPLKCNKNNNCKNWENALKTIESYSKQIMGKRTKQKQRNYLLFKSRVVWYDISFSLIWQLMHLRVVNWIIKQSFFKL